MSADDLAAGESRDETHPHPHDPHEGCCCCGGGCGPCCEPGPPSEPTALGRALERLLGVTAALCAVALMVGGTIALLRWWL